MLFDVTFGAVNIIVTSNFITMTSKLLKCDVKSLISLSLSLTPRLLAYLKLCEGTLPSIYLCGCYALLRQSYNLCCRNFKGYRSTSDSPKHDYGILFYGYKSYQELIDLNVCFNINFVFATNYYRYSYHCLVKMLCLSNKRREIGKINRTFEEER